MKKRIVIITHGRGNYSGYKWLKDSGGYTDRKSPYSRKNLVKEYENKFNVDLVLLKHIGKFSIYETKRKK